jgi:D-lactate dehydrogenase (cytochrome)
MARDPDRPFFRYHGPDLTGVFVGDNGAFGVKTRIAMRLIEPAPAHGVVTGRFETMSALADTLDRLVEDRLVTDAFLMDWRHHQRIQGRTVAPELQDVPLALHLGLEGRDERQLGNLRSATRAVIQRGGGEVIESASGRALLERPFQTMASLMVNPDGPIPTPVMGIVPYEHAAQLYERITTWLAPQEEPMRQQSVTWEHLGVGIDRGLLLETIVFRASNEPDVRAAVEALRNGLRGIYEEAGCFHFQLGRFYRTETTLEPEAFQMLRRLKRMLDPTDILNPGVLGL